MKESERFCKMVFYVTLTVAIFTLMMERNDWKPQQVNEISFEGFNEEWKIEYKQVLHSGGLAYYLDKEGKPVLIRAKDQTGTEILNQIKEDGYTTEK